MPRYVGKDPVARATWKRVVAELFRLEVLARVDRDAVARYCVLSSRWRAAEDTLRAEGQIVSVSMKDGSVRQAAHPCVKIAADLASALLRLESEYGLTAKARAGLSVGGPKRETATPFKALGEQAQASG